MYKVEHGGHRMNSFGKIGEFCPFPKKGDLGGNSKFL